MAALASDRLRHFWLFGCNRWTEFNENLTGSKISMSSTKFAVFLVNRKKKMAALASDWLRNFRLLLWNCWTEFSETWQEARPQRPLPSLFFSGRSINKNRRPGRFLKKVAHCTQVHDMWPFGPLVVQNTVNWNPFALFLKQYQIAYSTLPSILNLTHHLTPSFWRRRNKSIFCFNCILANYMTFNIN